MKNTWSKSWEKLTREEQDLYLTLLWRDGHTEQAIADFFEGATKGRIVRRRQTGLHLATEGRGKLRRTVDFERFRDLLDLDKMRKMEERGVACIAPIEETSADLVTPNMEEVAVSKQVETPAKIAQDSPPSAPQGPKTERRIVRSQKAPQTSVPKKSKQPEASICQWPLASGGSLKEIRVCGEQVVPGEKFCEAHLAHVKTFSKRP